VSANTGTLIGNLIALGPFLRFARHGHRRQQAGHQQTSRCVAMCHPHQTSFGNLPCEQSSRDVPAETGDPLYAILNRASPTGDFDERPIRSSAVF
jgi:hypothetical protein